MQGATAAAQKRKSERSHQKASPHETVVLESATNL